jgi:shikimate kinase
MRVFVTGVSCVGKTTIGRRLADLLGVKFFDLDHEIETFFGTTIERLQKKFITMHSYRQEAAKALVHLLNRPDSRDSVIALPPSGLMGGYLQVVKSSTGIILALNDRPENILQRITFYDVDSKPIEKKLTANEKRLYLREIKKDITYFRKTYERADSHVDISGLTVEQAAGKMKEVLESIDKAAREHGKPEQVHAHAHGSAPATPRR